MLVQAYQLSGDTEKARSYAQAKYYVDLMNLVGDAILSLSLNENDIGYCEETIRRITGILELYHLETLHPNTAAQFYFQSAIVYAANGREEEAFAALHRFEKCVNRLLEAGHAQLHGDEYFHRLDTWIDCLPLGSMAPRDKSFIPQSMRVSMAHPAFSALKENMEFQRIVHRLTEGASHVKD